MKVWMLLAMVWMSLTVMAQREPFKIVIEDVEENVPLQAILNAGVQKPNAKPVEPKPEVKPSVSVPEEVKGVEVKPEEKPLVPVQEAKPVVSKSEEEPKPEVKPEPVAERTAPATTTVSMPMVAAERPEVEATKSEKVTVELKQDVPQPPVAHCSHALSAPESYSTEVLMLQIFLDRHNFSAGVIDGVWGTSSQKAMAAYQASKGRQATTWIDVPLYAEIATMEAPLERYVITEKDAALVTGPSPATWAERAEMTLMGYETLGACIAERFHTSERTLRRLNPSLVNWPDDLAVGTILNVPNVRMAALQKVTRIVIVLDECLLLGYGVDSESGEERLLLRFPCSIARQRSHRPEAGELTVTTMAPAPNYTYDPKNYGQDADLGRKIVPPGPRNPVGSRWIGLSLPSYGIHGTPKPNTVGRPESRGCFRLTNWNVEKLFELVEVGTKVELVESL